MTSERFLALVAAYGADARRWPEAERAAAQAFAAADPAVAGPALAEADAADALLHASRVAHPAMALRDRVMGKLREAMRPEFLNRIDEIVLFRKLDQPQLHRIVRLLLGQTEARLHNQGIGITVTDEAVDWIATHGYQPEYGARPLRRVIQRELDDRVADLLVAGDLESGGDVTVSVDGDGLLVDRRLALVA